MSQVHGKTARAAADLQPSSTNNAEQNQPLDSRPGKYSAAVLVFTATDTDTINKYHSTLPLYYHTDTYHYGYTGHRVIGLSSHTQEGHVKSFLHCKNYESVLKQDTNLP